MKVSKSSSGILSSGGAVVASDLTVDGSTVTVDETNNRLGVNTDGPLGTLGVDGDLYFQPTAISTSHVYTAGSLDVRATANIKIGTDGADSVRMGRTNTTAAKVHIRSGADTDLVVTNSMVGIGTDAPDHTLSVAGDIDLTGGLSFDGGTAVTSIDTDLSSVSGAHDTLVTAKAAKAYADSVGGGGTSDLTDVTGTLAVGSGGTGATSLTDGGVLLGSGTNAVTSTAVLGAGELLIGDGSGDPTVATLTAGDGIDITNGSGSITIAAEDSSASNKGAVIVAGGTDCTVTYSSGTATVAVDDLAAAKITSGTFADARISSSSVIAHQGNLTGTGALDSGSITSGFGAINNGSSGYTTTGAATVGTVAATQNTNGETLPIVVKNADDTADADAAVGYGFDLETTAGATVNSAKIVAKKKESFTATASTQDAKLEFYVTKNGTEAKQFTLQGGNEFRFSNSNSSLTVADSSGDNQAGKNIVIEAGAGTGSGVPGKFEVKVSAPTGTAADVQTHNTAIVADGNGVSIYTGASLSGLANDTGFGEIIYWGTEDGTDTLAAGRLMSLNTSGVWKYADADAVATTNTLLAIALGTAVSDGLLIKGYFKLNSYIEGTFSAGQPCFVSEASGEVDFTAPSAAGDVVRIIGHGTSETNVILFDPSNDYVEL
tara:strand:- start:1484 stop:3466 length:1983 start_codon:yes stop_codon:yes gene_type:complete